MTGTQDPVGQGTDDLVRSRSSPRPSSPRRRFCNALHARGWPRRASLNVMPASITLGQISERLTLAEKRALTDELKSKT